MIPELLLGPDVIAAELSRRWNDAVATIRATFEALRSIVAEVVRVFTELASAPWMAELVAAFAVERRHHAHYARHAGTPRSRTRPGRRRPR